MAFAIAARATPVLNNPNFQGSFVGLPLDQPHRLLRTVETVALPRTKFSVLGRTEHDHVVRVSTRDYPYGDFYVDERFLGKADASTPEREDELPSMPEIIQQLESLEGTPYIWGGNWPEGIPELLEYYPRDNEEDPIIQNTRRLRGVDCTGLLYYASNGHTSRNTSSLVNFGQPVPIENLPIPEIIKKLQDLDLIVWHGHLICVLNPTTTIESLVGRGVVRSGVHERLETIMREQTPMNHYTQGGFVVRRWHPHNLSL